MRVRSSLLAGLLGGFAVAVAVVLSLFVWFLKRRNRFVPDWLARLCGFSGLPEKLAAVSPKRILSGRPLGVASALNVTIFLLDAGTLWAMLQAVGAPIGLTQSFVAIVVAFISGAISFLPGGLGTFEAACLAMLSLFHVPLEAALAATLLFRGLTLWLPLIPGLILARQDAHIRFWNVR